jgi:hypothetical protein
MRVAINTMVKNEEILLSNVLPIWKSYPVDYFIFYDDNSSDNTLSVIQNILPKEKIIIINDNLDKFNEGYQRQQMINKSRELNVDYVICLDADELLSTSITRDFKKFLSIYDNTNLYLYWFNIVNDSLNYYRSDPQYINNYRSFVLPLKYTSNLDTNLWQYHTPRTPNINLPSSHTKEYGIIHLQSANKKYYTFKQLWYKHYEYLNYKHTVEFVNQRYDPVVNNLTFNETTTPNNIIYGITINLSFFEGLEVTKGYYDFVKNNLNKGLLTFGKEYFL